MLRPNQLKRALNFNQALGIPFNGGSCFGVTDPAELRPAFERPMPEIKPGSKSRRVVMVDDGHGNMVPDDQIPKDK